MAKKDYNPLFEAMLSSDDERLTEEDISTLKSEAEDSTPALIDDAPPPAPEAVEAADAPAEAEAAEGEPTEPTEPVEAPEAAAAPEEPAKPVKKLSPAQQRIQEVIAQRKEVEAQKAALEAKLAEQNEKWARLDERTRAIKERQEEEQRQAYEYAEAQRRAAERPDPNLDPQGARLWDGEQELLRQRQQITELQQQLMSQGNQNQVAHEVNSFKQSLSMDIQRFQQQHPDYMEAARYATQARMKVWTAVGKTPAEADALVNQEALAYAKMAMDAGMSPAAAYYNVAQQFGYQPKTAAPAARQGGVSPQEKLAQIQAGQQRTGFGGRTPNAQDQDNTDIANMTQEQFASMPESEWLRLESDPVKRAALQKRIAQWELG